MTQFTPTSKQLSYFQLAERLSEKSTHPQYKMGSVVVFQNTVVGMGFNQLKTHTKSPHEWKMIHAEFHSILGVKQDLLEGASIYVFRKHKNGNLALAKPCKFCEKLIIECGIVKAYFTDYSGFCYMEF